MQTTEPSVNDIKNILGAITANLTPEQKAQFNEMFKEELSSSELLPADITKAILEGLECDEQ